MAFPPSTPSKNKFYSPFYRYELRMYKFFAAQKFVHLKEKMPMKGGKLWVSSAYFANLYLT